MRKFLVFATLLMASCKPPITDDQIAAMSNHELCKAVQNDTSKDIRLITFMNGRNLQCHPFQITCKKAGFKVGDKKFNECVNLLIQNDVLEEQEAKINSQNAQKLGEAIGNAFKGMSYTAPIEPIPSYQSPAYTTPVPPAQTRCTVTPGNSMFPQSQANCRSY